MGRVLFWVILIAAIAIAWAVSRRRNSLSNKEREELARLRGEGRLRRLQEYRHSGEAMRRCPVCGTYFPEKTGVWRKDVCYCSEECRRRGERS